MIHFGAFAHSFCIWTLSSWTLAFSWVLPPLAELDVKSPHIFVSLRFPPSPSRWNSSSDPGFFRPPISLSLAFLSLGLFYHFFFPLIQTSPPLACDLASKITQAIWLIVISSGFINYLIDEWSFLVLRITWFFVFVISYSWFYFIMFKLKCILKVTS